MRGPPCDVASALIRDPSFSPIPCGCESGIGLAPLLEHLASLCRRFKCTRDLPRYQETRLTPTSAIIITVTSSWCSLLFIAWVCSQSVPSLSLAVAPSTSLVSFVTYRPSIVVAQLATYEPSGHGRDWRQRCSLVLRLKGIVKDRAIQQSGEKEARLSWRRRKYFETRTRPRHIPSRCQNPAF